MSTSQKVRKLPIFLLFAALLALGAGPRTPVPDCIWVEGEAPQVADHDAAPLVVRQGQEGPAFRRRLHQPLERQAARRSDVHVSRGHCRRARLLGPRQSRGDEAFLPTRRRPVAAHRHEVARTRISISPTTASPTCGSSPGSRWAWSNSPRAPIASSSRCTATTTTTACSTVSCLPADLSRPRPAEAGREIRRPRSRRRRPLGLLAAPRRVQPQGAAGSSRTEREVRRRARFVTRSQGRQRLRLRRRDARQLWALNDGASTRTSPPRPLLAKRSSSRHATSSVPRPCWTCGASTRSSPASTVSSPAARTATILPSPTARPHASGLQRRGVQ